MSKLNEALGFVEEKYLDEAENYTKKRLKLKTVPLVAACAILLALGVAAVGFRYFAPGVGIVDGGVKVLTAKDTVRLGGVIVDSVILTESDENLLTVWLWRENEVEIDPADARQGIPPKELEDLTAEINGVIYDDPNWGGATIGYTTYTFRGVEAGDSVILRSNGYEAAVELTDARTSRRGGTIKYGKKQIELIQVSESDDLWAAEIKDDFMLGLTKSGVSVTAYGAFAAETDDGRGWMSGNLTLVGSGKVYADVVKVNNATHGKSIDKVALKVLTHMLGFRENRETLPDVKVTIPEKGETVAYDIVLWESGGLSVRLKSVTNGDRLRFDCEFENKSGEKIEGALVDAVGYVRRDYEYDMNSGEHISAKAQLTLVYSAGGEVCMYDFSTGGDIVLEPGTEIIVKPDSARLQYGVYSDEFSPNLGTTKLK